MIDIKDLIQEKILYSAVWTYKSAKHYLNISQTKVYEYIENQDGYTYNITSITNLVRVHGSPFYGDVHSYCEVNACSKEESIRPILFMQLPPTEEGVKIMEQIVLTLSRLIR